MRLLILLTLTMTACVSSANLRQGDALTTDTIVIGRWLRYEGTNPGTAKPGSWLDRGIFGGSLTCGAYLETNGGIMRAIAIRDDGFFAAKASDGSPPAAVTLFCQNVSSGGSPSVMTVGSSLYTIG
ncbi:MAG: hypothetical protein JNM27_08615, partial [Leptospirales bacterium]|nr:hypothetical protein [Leptospirales bacterium]